MGQHFGGGGFRSESVEFTQDVGFPVLHEFIAPADAFDWGVVSRGMELLDDRGTEAIEQDVVLKGAEHAAFGGEFREHGGTVLMTTHYMDEAERLCDRVAIFDRGKILAIDSPQKLIADLGAEHVVVFSAEGNKGTLLPEDFGANLPGVISTRAENEHRCLSVRQPHIAIPALLNLITQNGLILTSLTTRHATLEDVFVHYAGHGLSEETGGDVR